MPDVAYVTPARRWRGHRPTNVRATGAYGGYDFAVPGVAGT
ncbi:hypothetical protein [Streptomyces sp. NRRL S-118]|nr:hypothetical protein [Streptomyces sp. NRRL S-118]